MSKYRGKPQRAARAQDKSTSTQASNQGAISIADGYSNPLAHLGMDQDNVMAASRFTLERITQDQNLLVRLYRGNWLAKRIIDTPAEDMTRSWYKLRSQIPPNRLDELKTLERQQNIKEEITDALKWARLFGGAAAIMVIKGQEDMLDQPLDMSLLMPGCFRGLIVLDRWTGIQPDIGLVDDMDDPDFGLPSYYLVNVEAWSASYIRVHHSRILRFPGRKLPAWEQTMENYWGASEFEHIYEDLNRRNATSANIANLVFQANLQVTKSEDLGEFLALATPQQYDRVVKAMANQNRLATSFGMRVISSKDSLESHPYTFTGISDVYENFMLDIAGASEMPVTKLFGRAPAGMNATGESDQDNYDDGIAQKQESTLRPILERLLPVMCMSLWGVVPDDFGIEFEPISMPRGEKRSIIVQGLTTAVNSSFTSGIISQKIALKELRELGRPLGVWSQITDEDIENADDSLQGAGETLPLGLPQGYGLTEGQKPASSIHPPANDSCIATGEQDEGNSNSGNFGHAGRPGKQGGSQKGSGGYSSRESMEERTKTHTNIRNGLSGDTKTIPTGGFKRDKKSSHSRDHHKKMGFSNEREYESAGIDFMSIPLDESTEEMLTSEGKRVRYNHQKNWYGVVSTNGDMTTFYSPDDRVNYWERQVKKHGKKR